MICGRFILSLFVLLIDGVFGDTDEVKSVSVLEGFPVILETGLNKEQYEVILWYFNDNKVAQFDRDIPEHCLYDGVGGIFRDRLELDYENGSLTITNVTTEHAGHYEAIIIIHRRLDRSHTSKGCDSTKITPKNKDIADATKKFTVTVNEYDKRLQKTSDMNPGQTSAAAAGSLLVLVLVLVVLFWWLQMFV